MIASSRAGAGGDPSGRWQGIRWRRFCRGLAGFVLLVVIGFSWLRSAPSSSQVIGGLLFAALVLAVSEWLFARRMAFEIDRRGLVLCGPLSRVHVSWPQVRGLHWKARRGFSRTEFLYVETDQPTPRRVPRDAPIRIPTVASAARSSLPNDKLLGRLLASPTVRSRDGREADAMELIEQARAQALRGDRADEAGLTAST